VRQSSFVASDSGLDPVADRRRPNVPFHKARYRGRRSSGRAEHPSVAPAWIAVRRYHEPRASFRRGRAQRKALHRHHLRDDGGKVDLIVRTVSLPTTRTHRWCAVPQRSDHTMTSPRCRPPLPPSGEEVPRSCCLAAATWERACLCYPDLRVRDAVSRKCAGLDPRRLSPSAGRSARCCGT
jgi:hypothetical protein